MQEKKETKIRTEWSGFNGAGSKLLTFNKTLYGMTK